MAPETVTVDERLLEPLLREFVRVVGLHKTMLVVRRYGGRRLYGAHNPPADGELARLVGLAEARAIGRMLDGTTVVVPKAERALRAARDRHIREAKAVHSAADLAGSHGLTLRHVRRIYAKAQEAAGAPAPPQTDLFS